MSLRTELASIARHARTAYMERIAGRGAAPWWTAVLVTAGSERQAERYRQEIDRRREGQTLPPGARYLVVADPHDRRVGSGAATIHALWRLGLENGIDWQRDRVFLIHSGGDSRRLPQYSLAGKLFTELPVRTPWGDISTVFDETLALSTAWAERMDSGLLVGSGDVVLTFDARGINWSRPGVSGVAMRQPVEIGAAHGVYVLDDAGRVYSFLQKPSVAQVRASGGMLDGDGVALDTGLLRFDASVTRALAQLGREVDWAREPESPLDLYQQFTMALTGQWAPQDGAAIGLAGRLAETLHAIPFSCSLVDGDFTHVGTTTGFRRLITEETDFALLYEAHQRLGSVAPAGLAQCSGVVIDSVLAGGEIAPGAVVLDCDLSVPLHAGRGSIVHNLTRIPGPVEVPEDTVLHQTVVHLPDGRRGSVIRVYGVDDDPKLAVASGKATWFGRPIRDTLETLGLDEESVWPGIPPGPRSLWNANLFAFGSVEEAWACARFLLGGGDWSGADWLRAERLSLESSARWADVEVLAEARSQRMLANWQVTAVSLARAGADLRPMLAHAPGVATLASTGRALVAEACRLEPHAPTEAASLHWQATLFLRQAGLEDEAESAYTAAFHAVRLAVEAGVGRLPDEPLEWRLPSVRVCAPPRVDLGGGWSDTPPFCLDWGGTVLNIAARLNGGDPICATIRRRKELSIRCISERTGETEEYAQTADIAGPIAPGSPFAIPRIALGMLGISDAGPLPEVLRQAGGGIEIRLGVDLPIGSGLGSSSIIAATVLRALAAMCGRPLDDYELAGQVMRLEQIMTTGGGWQDQAGGIFPGAKLLRTGPGLRQRLRVHPVGWSETRREEFSSRFLFYYTGIRRIARSLVTQVVGSYLAREVATVQVLHSIKTLADEMAYALESGEWECLGSLLDRHWQLNQVLDPNTTNAPINALLDRIRPWLAGAKLAGAGGGGFLMLLAKSEEAAYELRRFLADAPGDGKLYDFAIAERGIRCD